MSPSQNQMTLGSLIEALGSVGQDFLVEFDNGDSPGEFDSYKADYSHLALEKGENPTRVSEFQRVALEAIGTHSGYKGGEYTMTRSTPIWRAEYGCHGSPIVGACLRDDKFIILVDLK